MARSRGAVRLVRTLRLERPINAVAGSLYRIDTDDPVFHLTFDDGPHPIVTPAVLDVLDEFGATATFFFLAGMAASHPELVRETLARGHAVGLHTRTHPRLTTSSWSELTEEIRHARKDLEEIAGRGISLFRPPYGAQNLRSLAQVRWAGMKTVLWSVDSHDWKCLTRDDPLREASGPLAPGGILLLHDRPAMDSIDEDQSRGLISKEELTRLYLTAVAEAGMEAVSLERLVASGEVRRKAKL